MKILGIGLLIVAVASFLVPFTQPLLQFGEMPERPFGRTPGERGANVGINLGHSIQGLSATRDVRAELQIFEKDADPKSSPPVRVYANLPFTVTSDAKWDPYMKIEGNKAISSAMYLTLRFENLPDDPDLYGKQAIVVASGEVTYPKEESQSGTQRAGVQEFVEETRPFKGETAFSFTDRASADKFHQEWQDYEQNRAGQEQGILAGVRSFMTYDIHPGLLKIICWGLSGLCGVAGGWMIVSRRRKETASQA